MPGVGVDLGWYATGNHTVMHPRALTKPLLAVLDALADAATDDPLWGLRICELADLGPGTVYPILKRLRDLGWVRSWQESSQPAGRPRRRYYELTSTGQTEMAQAVDARTHRRARSRHDTPSTTPEGTRR